MRTEVASSRPHLSPRPSIPPSPGPRPAQPTSPIKRQAAAFRGCGAFPGLRRGGPGFGGATHEKPGRSSTSRRSGRSGRDTGGHVFRREAKTAKRTRASSVFPRILASDSDHMFGSSRVREGLPLYDPKFRSSLGNRAAARIACSLPPDITSVRRPGRRVIQPQGRKTSVSLHRPAHVQIDLTPTAGNDQSEFLRRRSFYIDSASRWA